MPIEPGDALLLGAETRGLPPRSGGAGRATAVDTDAGGNRSLNLANAVAVVVYEAWRQQDFGATGGASRTPV